MITQCRAHEELHVEPQRTGAGLDVHPLVELGPGEPGAQRRHGDISGVNRTSYCGAYWGYGFHEDGVKSALAVCKRFGKDLSS